MSPLQSVEVHTLPPERFEAVLDGPQWELVDAASRHARDVIGERRVWNVNSTASGGGVAELLRSLLAYARGAQVDARWVVIEGEPDFFVLTKRLHHLMHGSPGDGGPLGLAERELYERVSRANADALATMLRPDDIVLLHDPQTAGMAPWLAQRDVHVAWRSHIGIDRPCAEVEAAWGFLLPYLDDVQAFVFTRRDYVPEALAERDVTIIPPSLDVFSQKNHPMTADQVASILITAGIVDGRAVAPPAFTHHDGRVSLVHGRALLDETSRLTLHDPTVVQVSRWDLLKDPLGVMLGFAEHVVPYIPGAHLLLVGPSPEGIADDPEGAVVLEQARDVWAELPADERSRIHLVSLPMTDRSENAAIVNALQRHASVVVQKSLAEGFGLTVAEAMWKRRPVVASRVGGIQDQVRDGIDGLLLEDPTDLVAFGAAVSSLLADPVRAAQLGDAAYEHVRADFLATRHLIQYLGLFGRLIDGDHHQGIQ